MTNVQLLNAINEYLADRPPAVTLVDTVTARLAVCWNWTFVGAANAGHDPDQNWAYLYVTQNPLGYEPIQHDALAAQIPAVKVLLDQARGQWDGKGSWPTRQKNAQTLILRALCLFNGLREVEAGNLDLELVLYYLPSLNKAGGLMYLHFEFVYKGTVTLTKGNGEQLKAFNGISTFAGKTKPKKVSIRIDPLSLSAAHTTALRDLVRQIPGG